MYVCICNAITERDLEREPELKKLLGNNCGECMIDNRDKIVVLPHNINFNAEQKKSFWKKIMQDYKIEIIIRAPVNTIKNGVGKLARELYERLYLSKGNKDTKVYSYSVEPIDRESDEYKFIQDMDK